MLRHEQPGLGHIIRALSLKMSEMQREIAGLRQEIRTLSHLVRELREFDSEAGSAESRADETDQQA